MRKTPVFSKKFFELDYPKLLRLTDSEGNQPVVVMVLCEGTRMPLKEFELGQEGLMVTLSSGKYFVGYDAIMSVQVMPQALRRVAGTPESPRMRSECGAPLVAECSW